MTAGETTILKELRDVRREVGDLRGDVSAIKATMAAEDKAADAATQHSGNAAAWVAAGCAMVAIVLHFIPSPSRAERPSLSADKSTKYTGDLCNALIELEP